MWPTRPLDGVKDDRRILELKTDTQYLLIL